MKGISPVTHRGDRAFVRLHAVENLPCFAIMALLSHNGCQVLERLPRELFLPTQPADSLRCILGTALPYSVIHEPVETQSPRLGPRANVVVKDRTLDMIKLYGESLAIRRPVSHTDSTGNHGAKHSYST